MPETTTPSLDVQTLKNAGLKLPKKALDIFLNESELQTITLELKIAGSELFKLEFVLDDLQLPNKTITKTVGATVESLLNQIPAIQQVQNKIQIS
ncbi:hypothetical protein R7J16_08325 [Acinetobacter baumannii]|uniref:hypothetical protein n=1 Tax=Acinetobacter calcoaceticus/baumannii complex TaxID=909768 RepID=UPI00044D1AA5|nr:MULTISPECIES: hypothetical protein [Acinetobacter calcoaceticus/baumannii complex]EHU2143683.1 hypothetical protein [Acinetobacter baumannii]EXB29223.1 hypothetical protein J518_3404 [Acinetobacter baumannii 1419130]MCF1301068.1 hypothetical protein [Acinetobacter baumannii]MCF4843672.1 hypothetical protein [Acinetobacter baumannii]MCU4455370.1 hypothetical protein [Acinetobacter pittii]